MYFISQSPQKQDSDIITEPRITQERAIAIVAADLKNRYPRFDGSDLSLFASGRRQLLIEEFLQSGSQLPLIYFHPNGAQFMIDSNTHSIKVACPPDKCASVFGGPAKNKLVYVLEIDCQECGYQIYAVDAITGTIIYNSPTYVPHNNTTNIPPPYA